MKLEFDVMNAYNNTPISLKVCINFWVLFVLNWRIFATEDFKVDEKLFAVVIAAIFWLNVAEMIR
jgi:hypothetical protein